jgi:small-conductance mechanosensitive channel
VGQELMDHPEHGKNFLQPLKSQGVNRMDDSAFIFRVKFMAKPGEQFVLRREVYRRVQEALAENDIHFAPKRVIVDTSGLSPEQAKAATAAAADAADDEIAGAR